MVNISLISLDPRHSLLNYQDENPKFHQSNHTNLPHQAETRPIQTKKLSYEGNLEDDSLINQLTSRTIREDKYETVNKSYNDENNSLALSQSPESYPTCTNKEMDKSVMEYSNKNRLNTSKTKSKRVSQTSSYSIQNNRYNIKFEGERSGLSGSYGGGLLENSRLVTEEY